MKTPEEIMKLLIAAMKTASWVVEGGDAHDLQDAVEQMHASCAEALACIQQLEMLAKPNNQIRWERDVAIKQLEELGVGFGKKIAGKVPKWISVEEELPKLPDDAKFASVSVIAYPKGWNRSISVEYERYTFTNGRRVERWRWHGRIFKDEITHWMPLPEPPKEDA